MNENLELKLYNLTEILIQTLLQTDDKLFTILLSKS